MESNDEAWPSFLEEGMGWVLQDKGLCKRFHQINKSAVSIYNCPGKSKQMQFTFFGFA